MMTKAEVKTISKMDIRKSQSSLRARTIAVKCRRLLLIAIILLLSSAMGGCVSKIRVLLRDSITREPIDEARVFIVVSRLMMSTREYEYSPGITDQDGVVFIYAEEKRNLRITIYPYFRGDPDKNVNWSWVMLLDHPARYGNTDWVRLDAKHNIINRDPQMEIKLEKYVENDDKGRSKENR